MSKLYVVSTPIGNLGDITVRAVQTLKAVSRILAEDTRHTATLLRRHGIETPMVSAHEHNEAARAEQAMQWLAGGEDLALVADAGTPLISDPGLRLVRAAIAAGHDVVPVPGASALLAALVGSGIDPQPFTFLGFPPRSGRGRDDVLGRVASLDHAAVFYEAPGRLAKLLEDLLERCGPDRVVTVARELTKVHETFVRGTLAETIAMYDGRSIRGEVVVIVAGAPAADVHDVRVEANTLARSLLREGATPSRVARRLCDVLGIARNEAYAIALSASAEMEGEVD
jgi:16S rRNA (cytidine1402-2'-O)-methyltransferase